MELKITKEKVIEAASKSDSAREILETLFPEVFIHNLVEVKGTCFGALASGYDELLIKPRPSLGTDYHIHRISFWLNNKYDWEVKQFKGVTVLIPKLKENG